MKVPKTNKHHVGSVCFFCCSFRSTDVRVRAHCSLKKNRWFTRNSIDQRIWTKLKRKTMTKKSFMLREMKSWNNNVLLKLISDSESEAFFSSSVCKYNVITTHRKLLSMFYAQYLTLFISMKWFNRNIRLALLERSHCIRRHILPSIYMHRLNTAGVVVHYDYQAVAVNFRQLSLYSFLSIN